jgi:hypothetical protein
VAGRELSQPFQKRQRTLEVTTQNRVQRRAPCIGPGLSDLSVADESIAKTCAVTGRCREVAAVNGLAGTQQRFDRLLIPKAPAHQLPEPLAKSLRLVPLNVGARRKVEGREQLAANRCFDLRWKQLCMRQRLTGYRDDRGDVG